uniref:Ovate family protein n=1 Tax=Echinostoma caproni TaxID=27848 RepID=A0A183B7E5_9TREM
LTGRAPKNYLECVNAHKAAKEALSKIKPVNSTQSDPKAGEIEKQPIDKRKTFLSRPHLPPTSDVRTNRLQETGFLLSPKTVRKASVRLSPSASNLLMFSQASLNTEDTQSMEDPVSSDQQRVGSSILADHCPLDSTTRTRSPSGASKTMQINSRRRHPAISWTKRRQAGNTRGLANYRGQLESKSTSGSASLSVSLSDLSHRCADKTDDPDTADSSDRIANSARETNKRRASIASLGCDVDSSESPDRAEALAWIEMELEAVRKILEANRKCAAEMGRKRDSRRAYQ